MTPLTCVLLHQAARRYKRMLMRAALYTAGGTLGALCLYGLIRMHRSRSSQLSDSSPPDHVPAPAQPPRPPMGLKIVPRS